MKYQFLEIKIIGGREVAYVLDTETGKVFRSIVEDFVNDGISHAKKSVIPAIVREDTEDIEEVPVKTVPKRPSFIPPALAGVFVESGNPGEAIETRRV